MWTTKSPESNLIRIGVIRIAVVERCTGTGEDQKRLVEEALSEVDFSSLSGAEKN